MRISTQRWRKEQGPARNYRITIVSAQPRTAKHKRLEVERKVS